MPFFKVVEGELFPFGIPSNWFVKNSKGSLLTARTEANAGQKPAK